MKRRHFITSSLLAATSVAAQSPKPAPRERKLGLSIASYMIRWRSREEKAEKPGWRSALDVLDHCKRLGAGCLQIGVGGWTEDFAGKVRDRRETLGIALEGQVRLPWKESASPKFESDLRAAKEAGATVLRAVCLGGRRYESFDSLEQWRKFVADSREALERAEPIASRLGLKIAVENHKDWRTEEFLTLLNHISSDSVGVNFDFGNNLALLEEPVDVAEALAPFIMSTHVKDMATAEYEDGFLLSEVPLGLGNLDLGRLFKICIDANPAVQLNLEMITRDPLKVPVLNDKYWVTMAGLSASDLARTLKIAKGTSSEELPGIHGRNLDEQIAIEESNNRACFEFARKALLEI